MNATLSALNWIPPEEQAALWQHLFQHTPGGLIGLTAVRDSATGAVVDFSYRFANAVALRDIVRDQPDYFSDITGHLVTTYFPSIRQTSLWQAYLDVLETQQPRQLNESYTADGLDARGNMAIMPLGDGLMLSYVHNTKDPDSTQALRQQSTRLGNILNSSPSAVVVFDVVNNAGGQPVNFRVSLVNQLFEAMTGLQAAVFTGMPIGKLYPLTPLQLEKLRRLMLTGEPIRHEEYIRSHEIWVDITLTRIEGGLLATLNDVTAEKESIDKLERQARLLEGILTTIQNGLSVLEAVRDEHGHLIDYVYLEASQALLDGIQLTREQVIGGRLLTVLPGFRQTTLWPIYLRVLETGVPHQFETHYQTDGYDRHFALSVAKLNDGLVVSYNNISESKQAQRQLETLVLELRQTNESLEQFAYVASHDLQEPLRKIISFGDALEQEFAPELSEPAAAMIGRMQRAAGRMRLLVQDLLAYARLTSNPTAHRSVPLNDLLTIIVADFDAVIQKQGGILTLDTLPNVMGDAQLLHDLFKNLISNSLKFHRHDQPSRITITGQIVSRPATLPGAGQCAEICISDNGIGFDEQYLDRIFTVFQRLHGQGQYEGTGIGLAICKKIVELHGGGITARSQFGTGTTFTVWLPVA